MATSKTLKAPLSLNGPLGAAATPDESDDYNATMKDLMGQLVQSPEDSAKDEMLAWTGGLGTGADGSGVGGALGRAAVAQSKHRLDDRQLRAQYIPLIMNAVAAQRASDIQSRLIGSLGNGGDSNSIANMSLEEVQKREDLGQKGLLEKWKLAKSGVEVKEGWNVMADGKRVYVPDPSKGFGYDEQNNVVALPGFSQAAGAISGAQERGKLDAQADYDMVDAVDPTTGAPIKIAKRRALQQVGAAGGGGGASPASTPAVGAPGMPGVQAAGTLGMQNNNPGNLRPVGATTGFQKFDTPEAGLAALDQNLLAYGKRGIDTLEGVIKRWAPNNENDTGAYIQSVAKRLNLQPNQKIDLANPYVRHALGTAIMLQENGPSILGAAAPAQPAAPPGAIVTGLSPRQKTVEETLVKGNDAWIKSSYEPALSAGSAANSMLDNLNTARLGLRKIGDGTGWTAEAQKKAAEILGALGVQNASEKATGYQQFQQAAMTQVNTVLNIAKGPQTDQDARRAQETFVGLGKTPQANQFLIDYAQAVAERDKRRADFYRQAYPIAQKQGDLNAVDRSWSKVDRSVWESPSMRRWKKQLNGG